MARMERWLFNILSFAKKRPQEARPEAAPNSLRRAGGNALPLSKVAIL
jgi:hypothetical protein